MAGKTKIEWADKVWNPIVGCSVVSAGCTNCYAMRQAARWRNDPNSPYFELTRPRDGKGPVWTGDTRLASDKTLRAPMTWRKPSRIFVNSMGDLFHGPPPIQWLDDVFATMAMAPDHLFMVLTKRPWTAGYYINHAMNRIANLVEKRRKAAGDLTAVGPLSHMKPGAQWWPLPNVWFGVSVENQNTADIRIPDLMDIPAAGRFISAEPLLGPIDLDVAWRGESALNSECWGECAWCVGGSTPLHNCHRGRQSLSDIRKGRSGLDYVIAGGESGPGARPMHPSWPAALRDQCASANVPFHFKQWGAWAEGSLPQRGIKEARKVVFPDGGSCDFDRGALTTYARDNDIHDGHVITRTGKRDSGHELDGRTHDDLPPLPTY